MTKTVYSLGTWAHNHRATPEPSSTPEPGVAQLIELAQRQSERRRQIDRQDTLEPSEPPPGTLRAADDVTGTGHAKARRAPARSLLLVVALGVFGQAWIGYEGRTTGSLSPALWYLSLCLIYTPSAALITSKRLGDQAKIWLTLYMSLALLATRFMLYPTQFAYFDELINYRTLLSIQSSHHLFTPNSLLPSTAYYPGMEIATSAIHQLTGLPLHSASIVILLAVRVIMTLALLRVIQRITNSVTVACLATLIYTANPQYIFFNSQFSYQTVALPLCFFCIYIFNTRRFPQSFRSILPSLGVVAAIAATHHLTSLALVVLLWIWYLFTRITKRPVSQLLSLAIISLATIAAWTWVAWHVIIPYIAEITYDSTSNIAKLAHHGASHKLFADPAGDRTPTWEEALAVVSVLIIASTLLPALWLAITKRRLFSPSILVLFAMAAIYPAIPAGHLTAPTAEVADRASGFVFVGIGYIVAAWWFRDFPFHRHSKTHRFTIPRRQGVLVVGLTICFVGGTVIGTGPNWSYGPGPYLVSAGNRSVDPPALQAAHWEGQSLPPDSRVFTDRINSLLAAAYGNQHVLTSLGDHVDEWALSTLLLAPRTPFDIRFACQARLAYLIADKRLSSSLPHSQFYIDNGEYESTERIGPPGLAALTKFDYIPGAERIFDNGAIRIYDLGGLSCAGAK